MSCTENESGPFVVFFVPAVVGCLTILLARRWATAQVTSGSTTAVSRRRKIIKDPLKPPLKLKLPPIACKMLPQGFKKANGVSKKGAVPLVDEDMNGNGKRLGRTARLSPPAVPANTESSYTDGPVPPKHIPFPHIPQDGEILFETMSFAFTLVATGLQFLNLYRTVWWLPDSNTNYAMNFYLIDPHLVAFIVALLSRRVLLSLSVALLQAVLSPKLWPLATIAARMFILGVVMGAMASCTYFIAHKYPMIKLFYLCYPAIIYFALFGLRAAPFLELHNTETPPLHSCTSDPHLTRAELDCFRADFNLRIKKILFNSVCGAYYTSFVPCCFAQSYLYYDVYNATQQTLFVWGALCARLASRLLAAPYCDVAHRSAAHLGVWRRETGPAGEEPPPWSGDRLWGRGARVSHAGAVYVSLSPAAAAEPAAAHHARFYAVFKNPSTLLCIILCLQLSLILLQLCLLFSSIPWHGFLAIFLLLFFNYYTMFKLVRDYLVTWKVYKAEYMIQDKNNTSPVT